jgi:2-polyprenyl-6-methoxyphenol hydroxylase-like FAD-dependent oxidoreductase
MRTVTIIGGGLAGLTLGVGLRRRNVPVTILEAGHYPRHRVCGEFISGRGRSVLAELDLEQEILAAGAREAIDAAFYTARIEGIARRLPSAALCVSRFVLDTTIANHFRRLGGKLLEGRRWREGFGEGIVRGTGRRIRACVGGWRWFGLKVHARNVRMKSDLELHFDGRGYVGLCRLNSGEVNICGLFRARSAEPDLARTWRERLMGSNGSPLRRIVEFAEFEENTFCSVAGLMTNPQKATDHVECCVGDALTMIAPLTGNGMSMAFESAGIAIEPLEAYSRGALSWTEAGRLIAGRCDRKFRRRLRWGQRLQNVLLRAGLNDASVWLGSRFPAAWDYLFQRTRE